MFERWFKASENAPLTENTTMIDVLEFMGRTVETERGYYLDLWQRLVVRADWVDQIDRIVDRMVANKARYAAVGKEAGDTPWWVVAIIHMMEGSMDFGTHLHNGDPLTARTVNVPAGRPRTGEAPFTWAESAVDALTLDGVANQDEWTVEAAAFMFERFNGFGYRSRGVISPYLAAQTNLWTRGKFVSDGKYDPNAGSSQVGALAFLRRLADRKLIEIPGQGGAAPVATGDASWFEFFRGPSGKPVVVAHAGAVPLERAAIGDVSELVAFLGKHPGAKTFLVAPSDKPIPVPAPVAVNRNLAVATTARIEATKGRSHAPGNAIDKDVLDPIRPTLVSLGHLGSSQTDSFWDWCGAWVTHVLELSGISVPYVPTVRGRPFWASVALVETWVAWAKDRGAWRSGTSGTIKAGDIVVFDWDGDRVSNHIGIVLEPAKPGKQMLTAEGNRGNREVITNRAADVIMGTIDLSKLL